MYPNELVMKQQHKQFEREAAHDRLVQLARADQPTLWQRLRSHLSTPKVSVTPVREPMPCPEVIAVRQ